MSYSHPIEPRYDFHIYDTYINPKPKMNGEVDDFMHAVRLPSLSSKVTGVGRFECLSRTFTIFSALQYDTPVTNEDLSLYSTV